MGKNTHFNLFHCYGQTKNSKKNKEVPEEGVDENIDEKVLENNITRAFIKVLDICNREIVMGGLFKKIYGENIDFGNFNDIKLDIQKEINEEIKQKNFEKYFILCISPEGNQRGKNKENRTQDTTKKNLPDALFISNNKFILLFENKICGGIDYAQIDRYKSIFSNKEFIEKSYKWECIYNYFKDIKNHSSLNDTEKKFLEEFLEYLEFRENLTPFTGFNIEGSLKAQLEKLVRKVIEKINNEKIFGNMEFYYALNPTTKTPQASISEIDGKISEMAGIPHYTIYVLPEEKKVGLDVTIQTVPPTKEFLKVLENNECLGEFKKLLATKSEDKFRLCMYERHFKNRGNTEWRKIENVKEEINENSAELIKETIGKYKNKKACDYEKCGKHRSLNATLHIFSSYSIEDECCRSDKIIEEIVEDMKKLKSIYDFLMEHTGCKKILVRWLSKSIEEILQQGNKAITNFAENVRKIEKDINELEKMAETL